MRWLLRKKLLPDHGLNKTSLTLALFLDKNQFLLVFFLQCYKRMQTLRYPTLKKRNRQTVDSKWTLSKRSYPLLCMLRWSNKAPSSGHNKNINVPIDMMFQRRHSLFSRKQKKFFYHLKKKLNAKYRKSSNISRPQNIVAPNFSLVKYTE